MKKEKFEEDDKSTSDMVHRIKIGALDPRLLNKEQRQLCVEALYFDGISPTGIAQFLKVTDRTIRRDLAEIRTRNALTPDSDLARQIVGEFAHWVRTHRGNLMKLAHNTEASTGERAQAEYYAYMIGSDMITKLQSLGYLPKSADALLVMQKKEESDSDDRVTIMCTELEDMSKLATSPEQANKCIEIKEVLKKEKDNDTIK